MYLCSALILDFLENNHVVTPVLFTRHLTQIPTAVISQFQSFLQKHPFPPGHLVLLLCDVMMMEYVTNIVLFK